MRLAKEVLPVYLYFPDCFFLQKHFLCQPMPKHRLFLPSIIILFLALLSCAQQEDTLRIYEQEKVLMGTVMKIKAVAGGEAEEKTKEAFDAAFREIAVL
ncbi:MAG: hypothetical protein MJA29_07215, partial [Candidatus Omnitrophica bacterium]|nr:hypothetical protein [Candidatus Omnitrophota bacterium]